MSEIQERYLDRVPTKRDWIVPVLLALMALAVSAYAGYSSTDKEMASRISVVETQQKNDGQRLERIEDKIDRLLEYVR